MSRLWKHSITVTRYGEEQRSTTGRLLAPASEDPISIPKCLVQPYKNGSSGFQIPDGRKRQEYVIYSGPTELYSSDHINSKGRPDRFVWEGRTYSVVHAIPLKGRQRTDGWYAIGEIVDNNTKVTP